MPNYDRSEKELFSGDYTCIAVRNLMGSDSPPMPTPVHKECWTEYGEPNGYTRVYGAKKFVVDGEWYESLPDNATCYLCGEFI